MTRVGEVEIIALLDGVLEHAPEFTYPDAGPADWDAVPGLINERGHLEMPYGGYLLRGPGDRIVLHDLGAGPRFPDVELPVPFHVPRQGLLLDALAAHGVTPADVTDVIYSHLHPDHTGWASVDGEPVFPHARHHVHADDWRQFVTEDAKFSARQVMEPLGEAVQLWDGGTTVITPWLRLEHAPGHTRGSTVAVVESGDAFAVLVGDMFHTPVEIARPGMCLHIDHDPAAAAAERTRWLSLVGARRGWLVAPHFPGMRPLRPDGYRRADGTGTTRAVASAYVAARDAGDVRGVAALLAGEVVLHPPLSENVRPVVGRDAVAAWLTGGHAARFLRMETVRRTVHQVIADATTAVILQNLTADTLDGQVYANEYVFVLEIRDGLVTAVRSHADTLNAARVGILPFRD